jgi:hypothetical protein
MRRRIQEEWRRHILLERLLSRPTSWITSREIPAKGKAMALLLEMGWRKNEKWVWAIRP